jgi:uroporphyrin-III C-methyltransferase
MSNDKGKSGTPGEDTSAASGAATPAKPAQEGPVGGKGPGDRGATPAEDKGAKAGKKPPAGEKKPADKPQAGKPAERGSAEAKAGAPATRTTETGRGQGAALLIATLAFLLSLGVGGALFYLWQQAEDDRAAQSAQLSRLAAGLDARDERLTSLEGALSRESAARDTLSGRIDTRLATVEQGLTRIQDRTTRQERGWQVAEVKHLQRMAGHRLRLMDDPEGALRALQAADELLAELGDPRLLPVREALASEIQALENMPRPDIPGIALRLERLASDLRPLPLKGQIPPGRDVRDLIAGEAPPTDAPWWVRAWSEVREALSEHIAIRRHAEPVRALPDAETELFLRQLITLRVEAARIAVLRLDDAEYQRHLAAATDLLDEHFDAGAAAPVLERLQALKGVTLLPEAPDISGSFTRLDELED